MQPFGFRFMSPLLIGTLLNPINSAMIATALVPIGHDLNVGPSSTAWLVASLYLAAAVSQPAMGRVAELYGPRKVTAAGFVLVLIAGIGGALAPDIGWLIVARALLGLGTSASYPAAITMIRARADAAGIGTPGSVIGMISITSQVSAVIGPALGGLLVGLTGWRSIFLVNVPLALAGLVLGQLWLPPDRDRPRERSGAVRGGLGIDLAGIVLFGAAMTTLLLFLMRLRPDPPYLLLAIAVGLGAALAGWELRTGRPFIDVGMLIRERGLSPEATGLVTLPMAVVAAISAAAVSPRALVRGPMLLGTIAMIGGTTAMITLHAATPVVVIVLVTLVLGLPQGLGSVTNQTALYHQSPAARMGSASGLLRTSQYIGAIVQSSLVGFVFGAGADDVGLHRLAVILGGLGVGVFVITVTDRAVRTPRPEHRAASGLAPPGATGPPPGLSVRPPRGERPWPRVRRALRARRAARRGRRRGRPRSPRAAR